MKLYAHSIIKRPISDVYNYLADVRNDGHWRDDIILSEIISEGPLKVGSEGRSKINQFGRELYSNWKCTRIDPPEYIEWELATPILGSAGYKLKAIDEGTDFTFYGIAKLKGITRLISPILQFVVHRQSQKNAENLKRILESNTP